MSFTEEGASVLEVNSEKSLEPFFGGRKCAQAKPQILSNLLDAMFDMVLVHSPVWADGDHSELLDGFVETAWDGGRRVKPGKYLCVIAADIRNADRLVCCHADMVLRLVQEFALQTIRTLEDDWENGGQVYALVFAGEKNF